MRTNKLPRAGCALVLAASMALSPALVSFAASDDDLDYYVGGVSENGYLVDDDDNYIDFDEAVCGPAADSDLRVPYGKTIYFPLLNDRTSGEADWLYKEWQRAKDTSEAAEKKLESLKAEMDRLKSILDDQLAEAEGRPSAEAEKAKQAVRLLDSLISNLNRLAGWQPGSSLDSGKLQDLIAADVTKLAEDHDIFITADTDIGAVKGEQEALAGAGGKANAEDMPGYDDWKNAQNNYEAQRLVAQRAEKAARDAEQAYRDSTDSGGDGYPFVHESQAVRNIKIKTDWDDGRSYIDSLSITKKRYKNSPYAAPSGAKRYAYFLAIEIKNRDSTSTSTRDVSGTVKLKKTSGSHRFDYDDVQVDVDFEIGFNHPEDANVIPIDPALFEPDEDFDQDTDEEFEFEADDDSYYIANTKNQKKIVLGLDTDYDDEIGDRHEYANLSFWNGNGATFNRSGYLYLYADEDDYLYSIDDDGGLTLLHPDYDRYEDCFVIRTRTLGRYVVSDRKLREVDRTTEDSEPDITVIYDVDTGVNYNPATGGYGADDDELWNTPAPADTTVFSNVLNRDGMLARPGQQHSEASSSSEAEQEISAAPAAALTGESPLAPPSPPAAGGAQKEPMGRNAVILLCILAAEVTIALTSVICYFAIFRRKHE